VYVALTAVLFALYCAGGMAPFDAACHAFTTLATGGVSTKNAGLGYYHSPFIETVTLIFMLVAGMNFNLFYYALSGKWRSIAKDSEARAYIGVFITATLALALSLRPVYGSFVEALRYGAFQASSFLSTAGAVTADYTEWPAFARAILFLLRFVGGCSGSTAGGVKVARYVALAKQVANEARRQMYPRGVFEVRLNGRMGRTDVIQGVAAFLFLFFGLVAFSTLATAAAGYDIFTSLSASLSVLSNIGIGFERVGPGHNYGFFPDALKYLYSFLMVVGRLELFTVFVLFQREYWRF
jgi:trk system potassium uptake protein TrkH